MRGDGRAGGSTTEWSRREVTRDGAPFIRGSWVVINAAVFTYRASAYAARRSDRQIPWKSRV